jgi:hypothetical protein
MHKCTQRIEHLGAWLKHCLAKIELCAYAEHWESIMTPNSRHDTPLYWVSKRLAKYFLSTDVSHDF